MLGEIQARLHDGDACSAKDGAFPGRSSRVVIRHLRLIARRQFCEFVYFVQSKYLLRRILGLSGS